MGLQRLLQDNLEKKEGRDSFLDRFNEYLAGKAELIVVPAHS